MMAKDITAETEHRSIYLVVFRGSLGVEDCCRYFAINVPIDVQLKQKFQLANTVSSQNCAQTYLFHLDANRDWRICR